MNRRLFLIGLITLALSLIPTIARAQDKTRVGVSIPAATHGWPAGVGWWAEQMMKKHADIDWQFQRAANAKEQAGHIDAMLVKGIDALVVLPFDSDTPLPAIKRAKDQGVYIVSVDRGLREPVADVYIAGDNAAFGRKSAEYMVEKLGGKGSIVILRGLPVEIDAERYNAAMEVFNKHPEIKVLGAQPGNWNRQDAHKVMQNFLTQFPQIDAVWASDDDMALGVEQAIKEAGRQGDMWIFGGAGMKDIVKRVKDKDPLYPADVTYPPGMIAAGIELAVAALKDGKLASAAAAIPEHLGVTKEQLEKADQQTQGQRTIKLDVHLVTPENAEKHYFPESVY
jgi:ribose transport system substrate-binding protein